MASILETETGAPVGGATEGLGLDFGVADHDDSVIDVAGCVPPILTALDDIDDKSEDEEEEEEENPENEDFADGGASEDPAHTTSTREEEPNHEEIVPSGTENDDIRKNTIEICCQTDDIDDLSRYVTTWRCFSLYVVFCFGVSSFSPR